MAKYGTGETRWDHKKEIIQRFGYRLFINRTHILEFIRWLYTRSWLNDEVVDDLDRLVKKFDAITEGHVDEDGNELFDMADELEHDIMAAQEHLEKIYEVLSSITDCWPDPDEEYEGDA